MSLQLEVKELRQKVSQLENQVAEYEASSQKKDILIGELTHSNECLQNELESLKQGNSGSSFLSVANVPEPEQYRKLFVGGLSRSTDGQTLRQHFEQFGEVDVASIMKNAHKQSRGFGFIVFKNSVMVDNAQNNRPHKIDGRAVETKRAMPKEASDTGNKNSKKMFVGGLTPKTTEEHLQTYFGQYGPVASVELMKTKDGAARGFAFVHFQDHDTVDKIVLIKHHNINGGRCECKKAVPKEDLDRRGSGHQGRQGDHGGKGFGRGHNQSYNEQPNQRDPYASIGDHGGKGFGRGHNQSYNEQPNQRDPFASIGSFLQGLASGAPMNDEWNPDQWNQNPQYQDQWNQDQWNQSSGPNVSRPHVSQQDKPRRQQSSKQDIMDDLPVPPVDPVNATQAEALAAYYGILARGGGKAGNDRGSAGPVRGGGSHQNRPSGPYSPGSGL